MTFNLSKCVRWRAVANEKKKRGARKHKCLIYGINGAQENENINLKTTYFHACSFSLVQFSLVHLLVGSSLSLCLQLKKGTYLLNLNRVAEVFVALL